ncbi:MAG TPA: BatA domain-containing protein [Sedimentisphaerales bacterium]|nr:BatA domain-containing protein [Sedimentisphaerales bacterium]
MSFTEWIFLLGGLAVAGPVIAHLLAKPRYRRLPFTMLRFLRSGQVESRSRRKLRDLLILLLRCAIIVLIAMLFARPLLHIRLKPSRTRSVYCLGLDNSISMAYSDGSGSYFEKLADSAVDYIRSAEDDALFNICALASGDWMQGLGKEQALAEVKALKVEPGSANVADFLSGLSRANRAEDLGDNVSVLVLSDFTPNTLRQFINVAEPAAVNRIDYEPIVSSKPVNNAAIADAHVVGVVEGKLTINAAVVNYGQAEQNRRLTARAGANQSDPIDINLSGNQRKNYQLKLDVGAAGRESSSLPVELSLSNTDGLNADDTFYLAVSIPGHEDINILLAGESENRLFLLKTAMETLPRTSSYDTLRIKQVPMSELADSDLDWADVVVSSTITDHLGNLASEIESFIKAGGRFVCFVTEALVPEAAKLLWQQDVLAALPGKCIRERTHIQPKPSDSQVSGVDHIAERSLSNYRIDKILIKGYFECEQHPDARLIWQFRDGFGFVYLKRQGSGTSILVNTSVDDSLGSLTKSSASVAFCRYLLGESHQIDEYCFTRDERVLLPISGGGRAVTGQKQFWVETCDGRNRRASVADSFLLVPDPAGIGWVKTLGKPTIYAGVNLPQGETDMTKPVASELAGVMDRVFKTGAERIVSEAEVFHDKKRRPLWKIFAWVLILLLLAEPAVANRLKR